MKERNKRFLIDLGIVCISSVVLYLAYYPANVSFFAWFALVPWLVVARRCSPWRAALLSLLAGYLHFALSISWIGVVTLTGLFAASAILALFACAFGWLYSYSVRNLNIPVAAAAPVMWVAMEYARSNFFFLAFPWVLIAHSQHASLSIIQIADFTGAFGVSFMVVLVNAAIAQALLTLFLSEGSRRLAYASGAAALLVLVLAYSYSLGRLWSIKWEEGPRVLVAQANIPQDLKEETLRDLERLGRQMKRHHIELTREAFKKRADLVVWPETMWPGFLLADPTGFAQVAALATQTRAHILIGTQRYVFEDEPRRRNSAVLITPEGRAVSRVYDKMFLVPVSEYTPLAETLPLLRYIITRMLPYETEPLTHGRSMEVFDVAGAKFSVVICFELSFDWLVRAARNAGAQYLINISNDGWFTDSAELDLALGQGVLRAIENRIGVVRSVNTGISCFINPLGKVTSVVEVDGDCKQVSGTLYDRVALGGGRTAFTVVGNLFALLNLLGAIAVAVYACVGLVKRVGILRRIFTQKFS